MIHTIEAKSTNKMYPLLTMMAGLVSFLINGVILGLISLRSNEGIMLILGVPIGSLLMLFILGKLRKKKILSVIIRSIVGAFIGFLAGLLLGELLAWIVGLIIPSFRDLEQVKAQIIPNLGLLIIADMIFGMLIGDLLYRRKSIGFFALVCAIVSIPFGILLSMPIYLDWISFDQNIFIMLISFGTTTGLSIGLYDLIKIKR